jgi:hypothetical protein
MSVYHFIFEAKPFPANPESTSYEGAYINCWINSADYSDALTAAKDFCSEEGWEVLGIEGDCLVDREQYENAPESLRFYDQAVESGLAAMFYIWRPDPDEMDFH